MLNAQIHNKTKRQSQKKMFGLLQISQLDLEKLKFNQQIFQQLKILFSSYVVGITEYQQQVGEYFLQEFNKKKHVNTQKIDLFLSLLTLSGQYLVKQLYLINIHVYNNALNYVDYLQKKEIKCKHLLKYPRAERVIFSKILLSLNHKKMKNLKILVISKMQINNLQAMTFLQCSALQKMILHDNNITSLKSLDKTNFKCLKKLAFTKNQIIKMPSFRIKLSTELNKQKQNLQIQLTYYSESIIWNNFSKFQSKKISTWGQILQLHRIKRFILPIDNFISRQQIYPPSQIYIDMDFNQKSNKKLL